MTRPRLAWRRISPRRSWSGRSPVDAGQSLVEFAIVVPVLLGIVIGIAEFGRAWNVRQVLTNAAREGARQAVLPGATEDQVRPIIQSRLADANLDLDLATIAIEGEEDGPGLPVSVTITYPHEFLFLGPIVQIMQGGTDCPLTNPPGCAPGGTITMSTTVTMSNEG
ncbi:MAG TPA: TadE/TadG family type IV pilus assembly protein [Gemmatimonadota bacterium]|nr:TadE/TadG family type IV pilus assembly protein [Gemmatimonadota bacterium]